MKRVLLLILMIIASVNLYSQLQITDQSIKYDLNFKLLESQQEIGKYITANADSMGFSTYDGKQIPTNVPVANRMITLRTSFVVDRALVQEDLMLVCPPIFYVCNIYLNGMLIAKRGNIEEGYTNVIMHTETYFLSKDVLHFGINKPNKLAIELLTKYGENDPVNGIFITGREEATNYSFWRNLLSIDFAKAMGLVTFLIALYFFQLSFSKRNKCFSYYLPFAFLAALYPLSYFSIIFNFDYLNLYQAELISRVSYHFWMIASLYFLLEYTNVTRHKNKIVLFMLVPCFVSCVLTLSQNTMNGIISVFNNYSVPLFLFTQIFLVLISLIFLLKKRSSAALMLFIFYCFNIFAIIHDVYHSLVLNNKPYLFLLPYAVFLLVCVIFYILVKEQVELFKIAQEKAAELEDVNAKLERIVNERTEKALDKEHQFNSIFEHSTNAIFLMDENGDYIAVNKAYTKITGYHTNHVKNKTVGFLTHPDDSERIRNGIRGLFKHDIDYFTDELRIKARSGDYIWINLNATIHYNSKNEFKYLFSSFTNITERKKVEAQMLTEREQFLSLLNAIPEPIYVSDFESDEILFANESKKNIFGANVLANKCYKAFHDLSTPCDFCHKQELMDSDEHFIRWEQYYAKSQKHFQVVDKLITWHDGRQAKFQIAFDVTELKNAEQNIRKLSIAVEQSPAAIVITDKQGSIEYINKKFANLTGYRFDEVVGKNPRVLKSGKTEAKIFDNLWATITNGKTWKGEFINKKKSNEEFIENATIAPVINDQGEIINYIAIKEDVTSQKKTEIALQESEEKFRTLFEIVPTLINAFDEQGKCILWNKECEKTFGWSMDEINAAQNPSALFYPDAQLRKRMSDAMSEQAEKVFVEYYPKTKYGETLTVLWAHVKLKSGTVNVGHNITKLKKNELDLKELNATKDKFFSIIAHDLKSPFNAILGFSEILLEHHKEYDEEKRESIIKYVNNSAKNAFSLLENLLTWSRSQSGRITFAPEELNIKLLLVKTIDNLQAQALKKGIQIVDSIPEDEIVFADENMTATVLRNLISNALKFTPENGKVEISSMKESRSNCLEICVADTGIGISEAIMRDLFRIDKSTSMQGTSNEKGTGLGLILCKEFIEKNGGQIRVDTVVGKGSRFTFSLPLRRTSTLSD